MPREITGEVIHVVPPDDREEYDLDETLASLAESRYIIVCRKGGKPSFLDRIVSFVRRDPIEPVTLVADEELAEGTEITATVDFTTVDGVYDVIEIA